MTVQELNKIARDVHLVDENDKIICTHKQNHSNEYALIDSVDGVCVVFSIANDDNDLFNAQTVSNTWLANKYRIREWAEFIERVENK